MSNGNGIESWMEYFHAYEAKGDWLKQAYISGVQTVLLSGMDEHEKISDLNALELAYQRVKSGG